MPTETEIAIAKDRKATRIRTSRFINDNINLMEALHKVSQPNDTTKLERQYADEARVLEEEEKEEESE